MTIPTRATGADRAVVVVVPEALEVPAMIIIMAMMMMIAVGQLGDPTIMTTTKVSIMTPMKAKRAGDQTSMMMITRVKGDRKEAADLLPWIASGNEKFLEEAAVTAIAGTLTTRTGTVNFLCNSRPGRELQSNQRWKI